MLPHQNRAASPTSAISVPPPSYPSTLLSFSLSAVCDSLPLYLCLSFSSSSRTYVSISLSLSSLLFFFAGPPFRHCPSSFLLSPAIFLSLSPLPLLRPSCSSPSAAPLFFPRVRFSQSALFLSPSVVRRHTVAVAFSSTTLVAKTTNPRGSSGGDSLSLPIPSAHSRPCENARERGRERESSLVASARPQIRRIFPFSSSCHAGSR